MQGTSMRIIKINKNDNQHTTVPLCTDEDNFEMIIDRSEDGHLRMRTDSYGHTFWVLFTKKEESQLLSKLKAVGVPF